MLKKLLRYDLKSVFKYWWIAAIASFCLSILGGGSIATLASEHNDSALLTAGAGIGVFITIMGLCAFTLSATILIFVRFYKNFFTDEGYLTFTLPVRRSQLINSKLIMSILVNFSTLLVFLIDIIFMLSIGLGNEIILEEIPAELVKLFNLKKNSTPSGITHIVQAGDTLWGISQKYGVTIEQIKEANGLISDTIYVGQKLIIPIGGSDVRDFKVGDKVKIKSSITV